MRIVYTYKDVIRKSKNNINDYTNNIDVNINKVNDNVNINKVNDNVNINKVNDMHLKHKHNKMIIENKPVIVKCQNIKSINNDKILLSLSSIKKTPRNNKNYKFFFIVNNVTIQNYKRFIDSFLIQQYEDWHCFMIYEDEEIKRNIEFYVEYKKLKNNITLFYCNNFCINSLCRTITINNYDVICMINMDYILSNETSITRLNNIFNSYDVNMVIGNIISDRKNITEILKNKIMNDTDIKNINISSLFFSVTYQLFSDVLLVNNNDLKEEDIVDNYFIRLFDYCIKHDTIIIRNLYKNSLIKEHVNVNINNTDSKHFTFVISSYNNERNIEKNLYSVINQNYTNWSAIYINDCSTDRTEEMFKTIISETDTVNKFTYIKNDKRMGQMYNKYNAYKKVNDFDIVCILDGDDWLSHNNVLTEFNNYYNNCDEKIICSNFVYYDGKTYKIKKYNDYPDIDKKSNNLRYTSKWYFSHLKTGYGYLFKSIPDNYLKYDNEWLDRCTDVAEMFAVSELADGSVKITDDYFYIYNKENSIQYPLSYYNDNSNKRAKIENRIKQLPLCKFELPHIKIINLKKDVKKRINILKQMNYINVSNFNIIPAVDGLDNKMVHELINYYNSLTLNDYKIMDNYKKLFNIRKKHITHQSLGLLFSVYNVLVNFINSGEEHILLLEDDIYSMKDIKNYIFINNEVLKNKDIVYLGAQNNKVCIYDKYINGEEIFVDIKNIDLLLYGSYSVILSKKIAKKIIDIGLKNIVRLNLSYDLLLNYIRFIDKNIMCYLYFKQLFIPEVRKDGINGVRTDEFYIQRNINLEEYYI
jgi:hypothetical protein